MIKTNIIRAVPMLPTFDLYFKAETSTKIDEKAWLHLELVYKIFEKFIPLAGQTYFNISFIESFLQLFASPDQRERHALKKCLRQIYKLCIRLRSMIRVKMQNLFISSLLNEILYPGIPDLLEFCISIISGFCVPLKDEHSDFLFNALVPLHRSPLYETFYHPLGNCIEKFIEKESSFVESVILRLLKIWPLANPSKELCFIEEMSTFIEYISEDQFSIILVPFLTRIADCISSDHFKVVEAALNLWGSEHFVHLLSTFSERALPIIYSHLLMTGQNHWHQEIRQFSITVINFLTNIDRVTLNAVAASNIKQKKLENNSETQKQRWINILGRDIIEKNNFIE
jgi:serine/threonine-protein phosphatase 2A regulatory subunit B'